LSVIDKGSFFGINPKDLLKDDKKLKKIVQMLERFNVWIEATVQRKDGQLVITDATTIKKYE